MPTCANPGEDLAYDLYALEDATLVPGAPVRVRTGIAAAFDDGSSRRWGLLIRDRSSLASKGVATTGGVIDSGYRGEIQVVMNNLNSCPAEQDAAGQTGFHIRRGDKIAQMIPIPVETGAGVCEVDELPAASRGANGFGSTGR